MDPILFLVIIPFIFGLFCIVQPKETRGASEAAGLIGTLIPLGYAIWIFIRPLNIATNYLLIDNLSRFILLFTGFFGVLITLYSFSFMAKKEGRNQFYAYTLWTIAGAFGILLSNHLILLLCFWGFLGITLYLMIGLSGSSSAEVSKKTFIIIGGSDAFLLLGIAMIWHLSGTFRMDKITVNLVTNPSTMAIGAFLCLLVASFAKAGAMPFHSWIPEYAEKAPVPATALLPASLDKLLGIYLLARASMHLFVVNRSMQMVMLIIGAVTIIAAGFMALAQRDFKKLLGYCAVSQVGYIVLGIATGTPVGIAGALFHMINHAIYKSCLFLCGGAVEKRAGTSDMDKLGGLARFMPLTFITCAVAAMAVSGVPPFNGFASKWMVYQGVIDLGRNGDKLFVFWLVAAMFGSALTLAGFMKLIHAVFLGQRSKELAGKTIKEVPWPMGLPMAILAILCIVLGVAAQTVGIGWFVGPAVKGVSYIGYWDSTLATGLLMFGLFIGGLTYFLSCRNIVRESEAYVGGEILDKGLEVSGTGFYKTVQDMNLLKGFYKRAEQKLFDIYEQGKILVFSISKVFQVLHTGVLPFYLIWCLLGMLILFLVFCKGGL